ncbi:trace amine-associated receptor 1-like [Argiope bruennichi]|uniref:Melanopsin like protein n=1 Tax=Argiope bruennichi TaxID=94029 RepID=A0A8T0E3S7_ARGBR|nr:trace amine-associated receptor 1-like [Argiope bruennichi]XP_055946576.1 trace amine-associated receptor 1-like [Argiope bruennichi]KAF8764867.1 Melanopsin like protein [Argiope bruennichi]
MFTNNTTEDSSDLPLSVEFELSLEDENATKVVVDDKYLFYGYPVVVPMAIIMIFIIIFAVGGNVMVVLTIIRHRGMKTRTNMFIVNLAVADILVAVLDMPVSLITIIEGRWVFGDALCKLNGFTMALFLICSIHTLMYISVHKYISITRPFSRAMTQRRIKLMILASWLWALFCATGPLVGWNTNVYKKGSSQCGPAYPKGLAAMSHSALITTSNYIIPLSVMTFCYSKIFREIHVHMKRIRETSNIDLENSVAQQKKVATTLFLVLACFLLCWTPYLLYSNAAVFVKDKSKLPPILNPLAYWCGYFNSACNPIIYAFRSPSFRKGYKEIMCGAQSAKLSAVNSMSFRSRSARGSLKSGSNVNINKTHEIEPAKAEIRRQRTLLSQTSWRSMPLIPNLVRSFSTKSSSNSHPEPEQSPAPEESPVPESDCGICGFWRPRRSPIEVPQTDPDVPRWNTNKRHSLSHEIREEDEEDGGENCPPNGDIQEDFEEEDRV